MVKRWATSWKSVQIPREFYKQVESYVKSGESGYASVSEYVRNAVRRKLQEDLTREKED